MLSALFLIHLRIHRCVQSKDEEHVDELLSSGQLNETIDKLSAPLIQAAESRYTASEVPPLDECKEILAALVAFNEKAFQDTRDRLAASVSQAQAGFKTLLTAPPLAAQSVERLAGVPKGREIIETLHSEVDVAASMGLSRNSHQTQSAHDVIDAIERYSATLAKNALRVLDNLVRASTKSRDPEPVETFLGLLEQHKVVVPDQAEKAFEPARELLQEIEEEWQHRLSLLRVSFRGVIELGQVTLV